MQNGTSATHFWKRSSKGRAQDNGQERKPTESEAHKIMERKEWSGNQWVPDRLHGTSDDRVRNESERDHALKLLYSVCIPKMEIRSSQNEEPGPYSLNDPKRSANVRGTPDDYGLGTHHLCLVACNTVADIHHPRMSKESAIRKNGRILLQRLACFLRSASISASSFASRAAASAMWCSLFKDVEERSFFSSAAYGEISLPS
jgi:hypothetical protein